MTIADVSIPAEYGDEVSHIRYRSYLFKVSGTLAKSFLWRLKKKYLLLDFHPLVFFYLFGAGLTSAGLVLSFWSIYSRVYENMALFTRGTLSLLVFMMGSIFLMFAMLYDMQVNQDNEIQVH